jgi:hypothetical protein
LKKASRGTLSWEEITAAVSRLWGEDWETLRASYGSGALAAALYLGRNYSDKTLRELGELAEECNTQWCCITHPKSRADRVGQTTKG